VTMDLMPHAVPRHAPDQPERLLLTRDPRKRASSKTEITALGPLSGPPRAPFRPPGACPRGHRDLCFAVDDEPREER